MKLGIMQPYFIPYIGYWQLINAVDQYVIYDDVNFIKGGWINRNRILIEGKPQYFNMQLQGASSNKLINEVGVSADKAVINKNLRILKAAYKKAPYFSQGYKLMEDILKSEETNLAKFLEVSIRKINEYLDIKTNLIVSSELKKNTNIKGQEKVIHICELLKADEYYNAIGGKDLYSVQEFSTHNIKLCFLQTNNIVYKQFGANFISNLSMLDVIMFNSSDDIKEMLKKYSLIQKVE